MTTGAVAGATMSTWLLWLTSTRPSLVVMTTSPREPPLATSIRRRVALSTMVSAPPGSASPASSTVPAVCVTNSNPSSRVPALPNASESAGASKVSIVSARARSVKRTTCLRSGQVTAHNAPSSSKARLPTRRFSSLLHCVKLPSSGSKIDTPLLVDT